jgi:hypothetical protein
MNPIQFYLSKVHPWIKNTLLCFRLFAGTVIPIFLIYFLFIYLDQGQDIMLITIEDQADKWYFIISGTLIVICWSLLLWYPARLISYANPFGIKDNYLRVFPRLIGFNAVVVVHAALFLLPVFTNLFGQFFHFTIKNAAIGFIALGYVSFHNALFFLFTNWYRHRIINWKWSKGLLFVAAAFVTSSLPWVIVYISNFQSNNVNDQVFVSQCFLFSILLIFIQWILWIFQHERRKFTIGNQIPYLGKFLRWQRDHGWIPNSVETYSVSYRIFFVAVIILALASVVSWFSPMASCYMGPFYTPLASLALLAAFFTWCRTIFIMKRLSIVFNAFLVIGVVLCIINHTNIGTSNIEIEHSTVADHRKDAIEAFTMRLKHIQGADTLNDTAYIVLADGGASRSGYWAALILNQLNREMNGRLKDHLLIMSSTSGGSVGNGYFYRLLASGQSAPEDQELISAHCNTFFAGDFLSHGLSNMLFPDLFMFSNIYGYDRGHALIHSMEWQSIKNGLPDIHSHDEHIFHELYTWRNDLPLLFLNTTSMMSGEPGVISNVKIDKINTIRKDVLKYSNSQAYCIPFSAAMIMSSRFPFISPGGKLGTDSYVDGGYFDNSGSGIVLDVLAEAFKRTETRKLMSQVYLKIIHLKNDEGIHYNDSTYESISELNKKHKKKQPVPNRYVNNYLAPGATVLKTYSSQTGESDFNLLRWFRTQIAVGDSLGKHYEIYNLYNDTTHVKRSNYINDEYVMGYPMSWVISNYNMERMRNSAEVVFEDVHK